MIPDGPERGQRGGGHLLQTSTARYIWEKTPTVINVSTPKLESCQGVSVSFYDAALEEPRGFGKGLSWGQRRRARISQRAVNIWSYLNNFFQMLLLKFLSGDIIHVTCIYKAPFCLHIVFWDLVSGEPREGKETFNLKIHLAGKCLLKRTHPPRAGLLSPQWLPRIKMSSAPDTHTHERF